MTEKVLDRKIGQDQSVPKDLVVRGRIRGNGAVHEHLVPTVKVDLQIAYIVSANLHLSRPRFDATPHELCRLPNRLPRTGRSQHSGTRIAREEGVSLCETCWGGEGVIRRSIPGWSDDGASHRVNCDTPPLKGLRLEPFGSIRNHCEESMRYAHSRFRPEPEFFE